MCAVGGAGPTSGPVGDAVSSRVRLHRLAEQLAATPSAPALPAKLRALSTGRTAA
jgi:hypothetical protein